MFFIAPEDLLSICLYFSLCHALTWASLTSGFLVGRQYGVLKGGGENRWSIYSICFFSPARLRIGSSCVLLLRLQLLLGKPSIRVLIISLSPHSGPSLVIASCFCGYLSPLFSVISFLNPAQIFINFPFIKLYSIIILN